MENNLSKNLIFIVILVITLLIAIKADAYVSYSGNNWEYAGTYQDYYNNNYDQIDSGPNYVSIYPYQKVPTRDYSSYYYNTYPNSNNQYSNTQYSNTSNVPVYGSSYNNQYASSYNQANPPIVNNYYYQNVTPKDTISTVAKNTTITSTKTVSGNKIIEETANTQKETDQNNLKAVCATGSTSDECKTGLTASSINSNNSFMPNSIWGWMLVIILILTIIIIARLLTHKRRNNYDAQHMATA
jgi:hypothetical protein